MWKIPSLCGLVLAVSACADMVIVQEPVFQQIFTDGDTEYAMRNGVMKTRVYGDPFPDGADGIERSVMGLMKGANRGPVVDFVAQPTGIGSDPYHIVMVFNAPRDIWAESICADGSGVGSAPTDGALTLLSGFCIGDDLLATASGSVSGVSGPDDPKFRALVRQVTYSLFPAHDHNDVGGGNTNT